MPVSLGPYNRAQAVLYAHKWAYSRNPRYYDYEELGGDCTNFASQCLYAGSGVMNYTPDFGWYYIDANDKAPAWTGVSYFYNFLTRGEPTVGPAAEEARLTELRPGDVLQLSMDGGDFTHTLVVVRTRLRPRSPYDILVAAHSYDSDNRPLASYNYQKARFLHIVGVYRDSEEE